MSGHYLPDTHVFIALADPRARLSADAHAAITDPGSEVCLSVVTVAEASIKNALGKLYLPPEIVADAATGFRAAAESANYTILPISLEHAAQLKDLPLHHRDPFDRLLICQAMEEGLVLISDDAAFPAYAGLALLKPDGRRTRH